VNARDEELEGQVDPTKRGSVGKDDKILWDKFENHFKSAWKDTAKSQNAYDKLMRLTMHVTFFFTSIYETVLT
jgi:hypothetical protein